MTDELKELKAQHAELLRQASELGAQIQDLIRNDATIRKQSNPGDALLGNSQKLKAASQEKRKLEIEAHKLWVKIGEIAEGIIDREAKQHVQAGDVIYRGWQVHPDAFALWKVQRRAALIETTPK